MWILQLEVGRAGSGSCGRECGQSGHQAPYPQPSVASVGSGSYAREHGQGGQQTLFSLLQRTRYLIDPSQDGDNQDALFPQDCDVA